MIVGGDRVIWGVVLEVKEEMMNEGEEEMVVDVIGRGNEMMREGRGGE